MDANPVNIYEYEDIAKGKMGQGEYDCIAGAATDEITLRLPLIGVVSPCHPVSLTDLHTLSADPAARGDVNHLVVGPAVLNLIIGARLRARGVPQVHPPHRGLGACLF